MHPCSLLHSYFVFVLLMVVFNACFKVNGVKEPQEMQFTKVQ